MSLQTYEKYEIQYQITSVSISVHFTFLFKTGIFIHEYISDRNGEIGL